MHKELSVKSRVRGDFHARFCERVRVKLPRSTRPDDSDDSLDLQLVGKFGDDVIYQRRFIRPSSQFSNVTLNKS